MEEEEEERSPPRKCYGCEYYGYDDCPLGGCCPEDDEDADAE